MNITEKVRQIRELHQRKVLAIKAEYENSRPVKTDLGEILSLYARFKDVASPKCKDNTKIFVLLVFFMYNPTSLVNKRLCRSNVRREIAKVLGLGVSTITKHFIDARSLFLNHVGFRNEAERLYQLIS
jgi:hypothetical protein